MMRANIRSKRFRNSPGAVLSDLDITVEKGEFVAVVGPSGSGKTTLLRMISGLDADFDGEISGLPNHQQNTHTSYMFQEPRLVPWLTVHENVALVVGPGQGRGDVDYWLERVGMASWAEHFPGELSGGMQRRVALARSLLPRAELLLFDEPLVSLDFPSAQQLRTLIGSIAAEEQRAVLYVTHSLQEALCLADRVLFLSKSPARIIHQQRVPGSRPRDWDSAQVIDTLSTLKARHPEILSGVTGEVETCES